MVTTELGLCVTSQRVAKVTLEGVALRHLLRMADISVKGKVKPKLPPSWGADSSTGWTAAADSRPFRLTPR